MASHTLVPYWIKLREKRKKGEFWDLTTLSAENSGYREDSFVDVLKQVLNGYIRYTNLNGDTKKTFTINTYQSNERTVEGEILSGDWGIEADFFDTETYERIEDARKENYAQERPYYFLFHVPQNAETHGILILKKYKNFGIKTQVEPILDQRLSRISSKTFLEMSRVFTTEVEEHIRQADRNSQPAIVE